MVIARMRAATCSRLHFPGSDPREVSLVCNDPPGKFRDCLELRCEVSPKGASGQASDEGHDHADSGSGQGHRPAVLPKTVAEDQERGRETGRDTAGDQEVHQPLGPHETRQWRRSELVR